MKQLNPYYWVIKIKNRMYDQGLLKPMIFQAPVIAVGNLTTGGTGKTPFVLELISLLKSNFSCKTILVISKSYKASLKQPSQVYENNVAQTDIYGDEACLIKASSPDVYVWSGPVKSQTLLQAMDFYKKINIKIDVIIIDDAFSHRSVARNLNLVLFDVSQPLSHYSLLPFGHLREDISELVRAHLVILTKINNADSKTLAWIENYLNHKKIKYIKSEAQSILLDQTKKLFVFSGLGNPLQLEKSLNQQGYSLSKHLCFPDHHNYTLKNQEEIFEIWTHQYHDHLLCTSEKDYIKITHEKLKSVTQKIQLKIKISDADRKLLDEKISQIF